MAQFSGSLNSNEIYSAIYNMIISQYVTADNIKGTSSALVDKARVDGGLYGDTKLYYDTDVLETHAWGNDAEASSLLALDRPDDPYCQEIVLDVFRQIRVTLDNYLSKRAWSTEGAFSQFNSVMQGWLADTKKVYDSTTYNAFVGGTSTSYNGQNITITMPSAQAGDLTADIEALNRMEAEAIAEEIANLFVTLGDINRMNDLGYLRSYDPSDLVVVWNSAWVNKIKKFDLPTMFHKEGLIEKFEEYVLPERYFGSLNGTTIALTPLTGTDLHTYSAAVECTIKLADGTYKHFFAGDALTGVTTAIEFNGATTVPLRALCLVDGDVICKVMHKDSVPYMSAFQVNTSFFNPRSLTETQYLTFGHNTLAYLSGKPFITISAT